MYSKMKIIVSTLAMVAGLCLVATAIYIQTNPRAFTTKRTFTEITLQVRPLPSTDLPEVPPPPVEVASTNPVQILEPVTIVGRVPSKQTPGAAMVKTCSPDNGCKGCGTVKWRAIGFADDKFQKLRGVFYCE